MHDHSFLDPKTIADLVSENVSNKFEQAKNEMIETFSTLTNANDDAEKRKDHHSRLATKY